MIALLLRERFSITPVLKQISIVFFIVIHLAGQQVHAQKSTLGISHTAGIHQFALAEKGNTATLVTDTADAEVVHIATEALRKDIQLITGTTPAVSNHLTNIKIPVIIGTLGKSSLINQLAAKGAIPVNKVKGKWETFCLTVVNHPFDSITSALVIFGSDARGTAFGVFELARMAGISPFVWWADVTPQKHTSLYVTHGESIIGPPSVKYRGIFINDEDWGIQPWAAKNMDTAIKDIGPNTYAKVFELMLRLKANYIWPAMHPCTKAFWYYPLNPEMARKYDIILGASHCEPLLRNNVFEWTENFEHEYGVKPGEWRYDSNSTQINKYWNDRVTASQNNEAVYTVGMRGIHDSGMPGPKTKEEKVKLLQQVILNQRNILSNGLNKPAADIPQIFCPYKEVLDLYRMGLQLPDDITLAWADDNYGYVRQLSTPEEQKRSGGSGVYYHFSYWGSPEDYLWLSTISPTLTSYELTKAYQMNAQRLWMFNVGDIKPTELEMQFAMDLAWNINAWPPEKAHTYAAWWAAATFGKQFGPEIGQIKNEYYRLAAAGKPEQLGRFTYTSKETTQRLADYQQLVTLTRKVQQKIPAALQDAYFELVAYPAEAAAAMNRKVLYARQSIQLAASGMKKEALAAAQKATEAFQNIQQLTTKYNTQIAHGKWNGMMSYAPRGLKIFQMPEVATEASISTSGTQQVVADNTPQMMIPAAGHIAASDQLQLIPGLGIEKSGLTVKGLPVSNYNAQNISQAPFADYKLPVAAGDNKIVVKCLPDFPLYSGMQLRYAISIDNAPPVFVNIATQAETKPWATNLLRGYTTGETIYQSNSKGIRQVRIYFPDPGLVLNSISVYN